MKTDSFTPQIQEFLDAVTAGLRQVLNKNLFGIYIYGSLSYNAFDSLRSDIDCVVVTNNRLNDSDYASLEKLFSNFLLNQPLAKKLEMPFIPLGDLFFNGGHIKETPQFAEATFIKNRLTDGNNPITWFNIRNNGITLFGPKPKEFIPKISNSVINDALDEELKYIKEHNELLDNESDKTYVVLTLCRILYTFYLKDLPSKKDAANWAINNTSEVFHHLIKTALKNLEFPQDKLILISNNEVNNFIEFTSDILNYSVNIKKICLKHFKQEPLEIVRMKKGIDNEVYSIKVGTNIYILRLNKRDSLKGSSYYIPIFKSKGIMVPEIITEDYSKNIVPYNYQILTKLEGVDIDEVIDNLSDEKLQDIAKEIADIIKKLITIPTNNKYGYAGFGSEKFKFSWKEVVEEMLTTIKSRTAKTGTVKKEYIEIFQKILNIYNDYFSKVSSQFYYDDMSSKNVMVSNGKFTGLVDLDGVAYGDFLESIGRIKASWYGTRYGNIYTQAVIDNLHLTKEQEAMITIYALLNRIYWLSEVGIQFNQNTSNVVDQKKVESANFVIDGLINELKLS